MKKEIQESYDNFCTFMEKNTLGTEVFCYGVALTGFTIAVRRVRPFSKFKKPSDIPNRFVNEKKELIGTIQRIEPNGALLMLDHKPLISLPFLRRGFLPIKIAGIEVSGLGISWLQTVVANREVKCIPIKKNVDNVECTVIWREENANNKVRIVNVGESLVGVNFAKLSKTQGNLFEKDPFFTKYFEILKSAEIRALKKRLGIKYYFNYAKSVTKIILDKVISYLQKQMAKKVQLEKITVS